MNQNFMPIAWLTPEEFNKKVELSKLLNKKIEIFPSITRVNMIITDNKNFSKRYSVDLVNGEKPVITNKG